MAFFTLRWDDGELHLLNQLKLPVHRETVTCETVEDAADAIRTMVVRGAPAIGVTAAYGVVLALQAYDPESHGPLKSYLEDACCLLAATRPTAVNLFWAIDRMKALAEARAATLPVAPAAEAMAPLVADALEEARAIEAEDLAMCRAIGSHGARVVPRGARILTHCNAGALATAGYGTALGVIRAAHERDLLEMAWVDETRPYLQGARLTAWELGEDGIPYTLICDNMAASVMAAGLVDLVVVGADRIAANGDVANKIGTYGLAVLCHYHGIPFYSAAPFSTVDLETLSGDEIRIEERPARELTHVGPHPLAPDGATVFNPAFDVTPHPLITGLITDRGILYPPFEEALREAAG